MEALDILKEGVCRNTFVSLIVLLVITVYKEFGILLLQVCDSLLNFF